MLVFFLVFLVESFLIGFIPDQYAMFCANSLLGIVVLSRYRLA